MDNGLLLARSSPATERIEPGGITALLDRLDEQSVECHSLMVVRHGRVVAEGWWAPFSASRPHLLYSVTKSFTGVAAGIAIGDGLLSLDTRLGDVLPSHDSDLTVEHLLTMTAGHAGDSLAEAWTLEPHDLVKGFLRVPFSYPAGTRHAYDNATSFVLHLTTEAVAAFGELLLRDGRWRDRQLIPRDWLAPATTPRIETLQFEDGSRTADHLQGYGYQLWMSRHGYRADGAFGQFCLVIPSHDLVVAVTAATARGQAVMDAVWDCLLPAVGAAASDDPSLAARLQRLSLPLVAGELVAGEPDPCRSAHASIPSWGTSVGLRPRPGGWSLRLENLPGADAVIDIEIGHRAWRESSPLGRPVVAAGAWQHDIFVADLYVITGPHRLRLTIDGPVATATWNLVPLTGPSLLNQLRSPLMTRPDVS